jgi:hypothetical protein
LIHIVLQLSDQKIKQFLHFLGSSLAGYSLAGYSLAGSSLAGSSLAGSSFFFFLNLSKNPIIFRTRLSSNRLAYQFLDIQ